MKISANLLHNVSFGSVIPIKKIVFTDDAKSSYEQLTLDEFYSSERETIDDSCDTSVSKKVIQALNRILSKTDGEEKSTFQNALNDMIRNTFARNDKDYKVPSRPVESIENTVVKPCYSGTRNYLLTGKEAKEYAYAGKNIGGSRALVRDFDEPGYLVTRSKRDFADTKVDLLTDRKSRLKGDFGQNLGIVIYADKVNVPKKESKGCKTEINIRAIDFEPV